MVWDRLIVAATLINDDHHHACMELLGAAIGRAPVGGASAATGDRRSDGPGSGGFCRRQGVKEARQVIGHGLPQDVEVVVDEAVAHACCDSPWHLGVGSAELRADVLGGFADDLDQLREGEPEQLVVVEVCAVLVAV